LKGAPNSVERFPVSPPEIDRHPLFKFGIFWMEAAPRNGGGKGHEGRLRILAARDSNDPLPVRRNATFPLEVTLRYQPSQRT
jgi:hypothetical protein